MPTYAYGANNPLRYTDPTGLDIAGDKKSCSDETLKMISKLRSKLRSGNIKSARCKKVFDDVGMTDLAQSDTVYTVFCTNSDKVPDCSGEGGPAEGACGQADSESRCATVNQNKTVAGCPSLPARIGHEVGHLCGPWPNGTPHTPDDKDFWAEIQKCAEQVANE